jgi:hypothetical protein
MGSLDVPEVLIAVGLLAAFVWAIYNRFHPNAGADERLVRR